MPRHLLILSAIALLAASACEPDTPAKDTAPEKAPAEKTEAPDEKAEKEPVGLAHPDNSRTIVTLVAPVLEKCIWTKKGGVDRKCASYQKLKDPETSKGTEATYVRLLTDPDPRVRWIGADGLMSRVRGHRDDPELTKSILASAAVEDDKAVLKKLAIALNNLDASDAERRDAVLKLMKTHPEPLLRHQLVDLYVKTNNTREVFDATVSMAREDAEPGVRSAAFSALHEATPFIDKAALCALTTELLGDAEPRIAEMAAYHALSLRDEGGCPETWEPSLTLYEQRAATQFTTSTAGKALRSFAKHPERTDALTTRAVTLARAVIARKQHPPILRSDTLRFLMDVDTAAATEVAKSVTEEDHPFVRNSARIVLSGGSKK